MCIVGLAWLARAITLDATSFAVRARADFTNALGLAGAVDRAAHTVNGIHEIGNRSVFSQSTFLHTLDHRASDRQDPMTRLKRQRFIR
jgi:hypothetical protein